MSNMKVFRAGGLFRYISQTLFFLIFFSKSFIFILYRSTGDVSRIIAFEAVVEGNSPQQESLRRITREGGGHKMGKSRVQNF